MKLVGRIGGPNAVLSDHDKLVRRVQGMETEQLVSWAESCIVGVGRAFGDWQHSYNAAIDSLGEARMGVDALSVVLADLDRRRRTL